MTRVIAATMIEQREGEVDAPARRKNLGIRCLRFVASLHLHRNQNTISLDAEEDKWRDPGQLKSNKKCNACLRIDSI